MLTTKYVCPQCLNQAIAETKEYARSAKEGESWREDGGLKNNEIIEEFVGFLLRHNLTSLAIDIRYAGSLEEGIQKLEQFMDQLDSGEIVLRG